MFYNGVPPLLLFNDKILVLVNHYFTCWGLLLFRIEAGLRLVTFALRIKNDFARHNNKRY